LLRRRCLRTIRSRQIFVYTADARNAGCVYNFGRCASRCHQNRQTVRRMIRTSRIPGAANKTENRRKKLKAELPAVPVACSLPCRLASYACGETWFHYFRRFFALSMSQRILCLCGAVRSLETRVRQVGRFPWHIAHHQFVLALDEFGNRTILLRVKQMTAFSLQTIFRVTMSR